ncbi:sodium:solute symporter family transporter [Botrimarina hoheduenensis]|uniref:Sodium/glucose cotransporter n=1 Tax=Botrimarina hoheduenensis TaxID=2528000 RepID=A0A5C5VUU4_9BACT|nr:sodium/solute symporter [Botrimarina hoheduenensis]TWT41419.1 Sodium/glucose cotransporter [Botrimarina hoheduenensis]
MNAVDIAVFVAFIASVVFVGLWKSREADGEKDAQDFFLAGRGLTWWLVGFSLIAANISTEQFVGMSGSAASHVGLAIASYEWMAAVTLVVVAFCFLPYFLRAGIYTIPEFLEYRFNGWARLIMAAMTVLIYLLLLGAVTYSGALTVQTLGKTYGYTIELWQPSLVIALIAMVYVVAGGLKASVWADLLQGSALILGGALIMWLAFDRLGSATEAATVGVGGAVEVLTLDPEKGAFERFMDLNSNRLNMFLPEDDHVLPWTALLLGLWIPNFYYWGLNQYITQRTLGSSSLSQGQKGIVFASYLKLIIPFVVVIPGIIAFNLFHEEMRLEARGDRAGAIALYSKANPETRFVRILDNAQPEELDSHQGPDYLVSVYDSEKPTLPKNPLVMAISRKDYDEIKPAQHQVFSYKEDKVWATLNPEFAEEIIGYNAVVDKAAKSSKLATTSEALVAYKYDTALGLLLAMLPKNTGMLGFVLAALLGAVVSSLPAMLNAASSIFTLDLFQKHVAPNASQATIVLTGRIAVVVFAIVACGLAPLLGDPNISNSIFAIIQESQGLISPGILAVFITGLLLRRCPRWAGTMGLLTSIVCYAGLKYIAPEIQFLNRMAIVFALCVAMMAAATKLAPLAEPIVFETKTQINLDESKGAKTAGIICVLLTLALYVVFSPLGVAR